ncbi:hypothetical protein FWP33_20415 [Vibrio parahaemolyticus]|nr:hypothetical protein [Vibrio parahaemolyticus]
MKNLANLAFAIGLSFGATTFASSAFAIANNNPTLISKQISEMRSTTYVSNANTPIRDIKSQAKRQLVSETLDILPTYITSTQSLVNNEYTEKMQFVAAALIDVSKEQYDIKYEKDMITVTLDARVTFDTNEINRKVQAIQDNEDRNKIVESTLTKQLKLEAQVKEINDLFKVSMPNEVKQGLVEHQELLNELVNVPLGDMVAAFELESKVSEAADKIRITSETNEEWLSLTDEQRFEYEVNLEVGRLINEGYMNQINRPLKLAVRNVSEKTVTLTVEPLEGPNMMMPWYIASHENFIPLVNRVAGGLENVEFLNSGCYFASSDHKKEMMWLEIFDKGHFQAEASKLVQAYQNGLPFSPAKNTNYSLSNLNIKFSSNEYNLEIPKLAASVPGTETPVFFVRSNTNEKNVLFTLPQNVQWNKTKAELNAKSEHDKWLLARKNESKVVDVWGLEITINGIKQTIPWIQRHEDKAGTFTRGGKKMKDSKAVAWNGGSFEYSPSREAVLNNMSTKKHQSNYKYIDPIRNGYIDCGVITMIDYPTFTVPRSLAKNLSQAEIKVFRY